MVRTRIAPSPTGIAHLGTAYTALRNWALARREKGQFIIRIEDTDRDRYVEGAEKIIFEALEWLGLDNDEGPNVGGPHAPYTQSQRLDLYKKHAQKLVKKDKAYYCFCTKDRLEKIRLEQQARKELPRYDRHCRHLSPAEIKKHLSANDPYVVRLKVPQKGVTVAHDVIRGEVKFENSGLDDQVLLKSDVYPTYHLAVVVDDHLMKITHIIRGEEWLSSTPKHILLYQAFGWKLPIFAHLPIIRNQDHSKMSKRHNDVSILSYRDRGYLPEALNNFLALMGWSHPAKKEVFDLQDFVTHFSLERVQLTAPVFDLTKLNWLNGIYIRKLPDADLALRLQPFIPPGCPDDIFKKIIPLVKERLVTLADFESLTEFFYRDIKLTTKDLTEQSRHSAPDTAKALKQFTHDLEKLSSSAWQTQKLDAVGHAILKSLSWSPRELFMTIRVAVTGKEATPPLFETMEVLGKKEVIKRLNYASSRLRRDFR
ncbi:MAG: glutamate--tRNA ligase [Candidatus Chisholmbacteria bacterium]|nr:glutamate--tRNA ligase [Candidatus Chisholmbacteria bacterium]